MGKAAVTTIAKRVMFRNTERKRRTFSLFTAKQVSGGGLSRAPDEHTPEDGAFLENVPKLLQILQGTSAQARLGNNLQATYGVITGYIRSNPFNSAVNSNHSPFEITMLIFKKKDDNYYNSPVNLKDSKVGTYVAINGTVQNDMLPYNRAGYVIYKIRKWRMKPQPVPIYNIVPAPPTPDPLPPDGAPSATVGYINTETGSALLPSMVRFKQRIPLPRILRYDENTQDVLNSSFAIGFFVINCDGANVASDQIRASVWMDTTVTWID